MKLKDLLNEVTTNAEDAARHKSLKLNWDKFVKKYNLDPKQYSVDYDAMDEEFGFYSKSSSNNSGTFFNQQFTSSDEDEFWKDVKKHLNLK